MRRDWFRAFAAETDRLMGAVTAMAAMSPTPVAHVAHMSPTVPATVHGGQLVDEQGDCPVVAHVAHVARHFEVMRPCADAVPMEWTNGLG